MKTENWGMNARAVEAGHKPYDPESEWQPGRWNSGDAVAARHSLCPEVHKKLNNLQGQWVRTQYNSYVNAQLKAAYKKIGCDGFEVVLHPEDAARYFPAENEFVSTIGVCSCCILTD